MTTDPTDTDGESFEGRPRYPGELAQMQNLLDDTARSLYREEATSKGHWRSGTPQDPDWHFWKASDEASQARHAAKEDDVMAVIHHIGHGWNHLLMAAALIYYGQSKVEDLDD